jgi:hypothetical protein
MVNTTVTVLKIINSASAMVTGILKTTGPEAGPFLFCDEAVFACISSPPIPIETRKGESDFMPSFRVQMIYYTGKSPQVQAQSQMPKITADKTIGFNGIASLPGIAKLIGP